MRVLQEKVPLQEGYILIRAERWRKSLKEELRLLVLYDFYTVEIYFKELVTLLAGLEEQKERDQGAEEG